MTQSRPAISSTRQHRALDIIRIVTASVLAIHSIYRIIKGDVPGFGQFLGSIGFPLGVALAWLITIGALAASIALIIKHFIIPACITHMFILIMGIFLDHIHDGWFVVGGGNNGMEYSVTLIASLSAIIFSSWPEKPV